MPQMKQFCVSNGQNAIKRVVLVLRENYYIKKFGFHLRADILKTISYVFSNFFKSLRD